MKRSFTFAVVLIIAFIARAQDRSAMDSVNMQELQVNARLNKEFSEAGKVVKVIYANEINLMPIKSLDDLLEKIAGVDIRQRGIGGTQADISLRGGSFDQVLIMLNGINITDPQTGHHNLNIPLDFTEISRIEVLQGSAARRYGNQAFSGAINIVTEPSEKNTIRAELTGGSYNTFTEKLSVALGKKSLRNFTSFSHYGSAGYTNNTDYDHTNLFNQTQFKNDKLGTFDFQAAYQEKAFGANGFYTLKFPDQFEYTQTAFASLSWNKNIQDLSLVARAYWRNNYDRFELFRDNENAPSWYTSHNYHQTDVIGGLLNASYFSMIGKFSGGVESRYDHIFSTVLGETMTTGRPNHHETKKPVYYNHEAARLVNTAFVDYTKNWENFNLSAGGSLSYSQDYGQQYHYGADLSYFLNQSLALYSSANTASRLPTFTDLYYKSATQDANPNLLPENSTTFELGIKLNNYPWKASAGIFYRKGHNIIDWVLLPSETKWKSMNLTGLNTLGTDLSVSYKFRKSFMKSIDLSYTFLTADKEATGYDSKYALDYMKHQILLNINHSVVKNVSMNWNMNYFDRAGGYTDFTSGVLTSYAPYLLISNRTSWKIRQLTIFVDLDNILNKEYVDFGGLPLPGIQFYGGLSFRFH